MNRREFAIRAVAAGSLLPVTPAETQTLPDPAAILPGVWRFRFGTPEAATPVTTRRYLPSVEALHALTRVAEPPFSPASITGSASRRGFLVSLPLAPGELVYGLGLQLQSFLQRGLKKKLRVNADPKVDSGDSHAPVPFYVTTNGYGVLIDTARYATFYLGNKVKKGERRADWTSSGADNAAGTLPAAYARFHTGEASRVLVEIPAAHGADVYLFAGPTMLEAVQRYNLFSGGGPLPPRWALGFWYRCFGQFDSSEVLATAAKLREREIPCDVLGLEPGWQSHAYSCSFVWSDKFPNPGATISALSKTGYRVNLWEHAFTHPTSPIYKPLLPYSGDYEVWDGLVPDFLLPRARAIFANFHEREHVSLGISGYKLDECDNSDFTRNWSFPELSRFPSGVDGEQMHSLFGLRYQDTISGIFEGRNTRAFGLVRSSGALAAPYPYALYSDLYDHSEFIRGVVNAGFCGLLWCPEVRDAQDPQDLLLRLQTAIFSPVAMVNAWYIRNPPWQQVDRQENNAGRFAPGWEEVESACRSLVQLRMRLLPYLYTAYVRYHREGLPPFRALVLDYPAEPPVWTIDDQYLMGESLLVAPVAAGHSSRDVYLPAGDWFDFFSGTKHPGRQTIQVTAARDRVPVFVKSGALLPLAEPAPHSEDPRIWQLTVRGYGQQLRPFVLYEDDGSLRPHFETAALAWDPASDAGTMRSSAVKGSRYQVLRWERTL